MIGENNMKEKTKIYAPGYYGDFRCIADKCTHSCCVGWEIYIDPDTMEKYHALKHGYSGNILESIEGGDEPHFRMCDGGRCPHLDDNGLCRIITNCGEEYLSDICREHPRFYNRTSRGIVVGLGMSCEEAARIILSSDAYRDFAVVGETDEASDVEFDAMSEVERIFDIIATNPDRPSRLEKIHMLYGVTPECQTDAEWRELLSGLEYLDPAHKELFLAYTSKVASLGDVDKLLKRALAYFVYRHCASADGEADFRASLGLALFLERLFASIMQKEDASEALDATRVARIISEELEYSEENTDEIRLEFCF